MPALIKVIVVLTGALPKFLELQVTPSSSCIFPAHILESVISPRRPGFCYLRIMLETKIWVLGMIVAPRMPLLLGSLRRQNLENIYVYTNYI